MILDTNGLSALAEGEPAIEPLLRKANEIAIPVIVLGNTGMASRIPVIGSITKTGSLPTCRNFAFLTLTNQPPSSTVMCARS